MTETGACALEIRDVAEAPSDVPRRCLRDPAELVDWHRGLAKQLSRIADRIGPRPAAVKSRSATRHGRGDRASAGTIAVRGRSIRLERRSRGNPSRSALRAAMTVLQVSRLRLSAGADGLEAMDVTRHKSVQIFKGYDPRAKAFKNHAGKGCL